MLLPNILGAASAAEMESEQSDVTVSVVEVKDASSSTASAGSDEPASDSGNAPAAGNDSASADDSAPADESNPASDTTNKADGDDASASENEGKSEDAAASDSTSSSENEPTIGVIALAGEAGSGEDEDGTPDAEGTDDNEEPKDDGEWDITKTERPAASGTVSAGTGSSEDKVNPPAEGKEWDIFYDAERDVYKITFNISDKTEQTEDLTIDLTQALVLLGKYAEAGKQELNDTIAALTKPVKDNAGDAPVMGDAGEAPVEPEAPAAFDGEKPEEPKEPGKPEGLDKATQAVWDKVFDLFSSAGGNQYNTTDNVLMELEAAGVDPKSDYAKEYAKYLVDKADNAFLIQVFETRGEVGGSFTLATPELKSLYEQLGIQTDGLIVGFDGQELGGTDLRPVEAAVSFMSKPMLDLFEKAGIDRGEVGLWLKSHDFRDVLEGWYDSTTEEQETALHTLLGLEKGFSDEELRAAVENWVIGYYSKDGQTYENLADLAANNPQARADLSSTTGNAAALIGGSEMSESLGAGFNYNNFYQSLFGFAFGDENGVVGITDENGNPVSMTEFLGNAKFNPETGFWEYGNKSWTDNGYQMALYYYMDHQEIWEKTDTYSRAF